MNNKENIIQLKSWLKSGELIEESEYTTPAHTFIESLYPNRTDIDSIVPGSKNREKNDKLTVLDATLGMPSGFDFYSEKVLPVFAKISSTGLYTVSGDIEPTFYNAFTKNGRVTKRHIRGSTLYDKTGLAKKYISRYKNGCLVEVDYDAHHLRLISQQINFTAPEGSFHKYLASYYFDGEYDYKEAKQITFQAMYGKMPDEFKNIPFFNLLSKFKWDLWTKYQKDGYVACPTSGRQIKARVKDIGQLLNYYICALETAENVNTLDSLKYPVSMYAYDSFLFDLPDISLMQDIVKSLPHLVTFKSAATFHDIRHSS